MRIVFCGSGLFAQPSLRAILDAGHEVLGVLTQPARPRGRGGKIGVTAIEELAKELQLPVFESQNINQDLSVQTIRSLGPDVICVVDFGQLIRQEVRSLGRLGTFNLHGSLLPELRGAAPINWAIIRGLTMTGVTTFELVDEIDAGPIYVQKQTHIELGETLRDLRSRLGELGAEAVLETLELLDTGRAEPKDQDHSKATLAPRLTKADGWIDWSASAAICRDLIHGCWPWPTGQTLFSRSDGKDISVGIARAEADDETPAKAAPGALDDELVAGTGGGRLRILQIRPAGGRLMDWKDFINGYRVRPGDRFVSPT